MGAIVDRFHDVAREHDVVLVVGSDFTDVAAPTEFSVNAAVAANLGSRLLLVVPARGHDARRGRHHRGDGRRGRPRASTPT